MAGQKCEKMIEMLRSNTCIGVMIFVRAELDVSVSVLIYVLTCISVVEYRKERRKLGKETSACSKLSQMCNGFYIKQQIHFTTRMITGTSSHAYICI